MPGARCARKRVCNGSGRAHTRSSGHTGITRHSPRNGLRLISRSPRRPLSDSHILEPQSGTVFDAAEVFEAYSHHLWTGLSVIGGPSSKPGNDPRGEGERAFWMWVLLPRGGPFELRRQGLQYRLVIRLESLDPFLFRR